MQGERAGPSRILDLIDRQPADKRHRAWRQCCGARELQVVGVACGTLALGWRGGRLNAPTTYQSYARKGFEPVSGLTGLRPDTL